MRRSVPCGAAVVVLVALFSHTTAAQEPKSPALAKQLCQLLDERQLTVVAAKDTEENRFVAASYVPNVQLLAVSASYSAPAILDGLLAQKKYGDIYAELNGGSTADTRLFIQDLGADGLLPDPRDGGRFDIVYEHVVKQTVFDGNWKKQGLTEDQYRAAYLKMDAQYARMLSLLIAELKRAEPASAGAASRPVAAPAG
jgi:hypothetical protein